MKKNNILVVFVLLLSLKSIAQLAIGDWRTHLSYRQAIGVAEGGGKVFCISQGGIFSYSKSDNAIETLTKLNGLSDFTASAINYDEASATLVIGYKNGNIDIIKNGIIYNVPDIKIKTITGNKAINNIFFKDNTAFLSCGFGVIALNIEKKEIRSTYYIGPLGTAINIREITSDGINLFAATNTGIVSAPLNAPNLADYNYWTQQAGLPVGIYNTITFFNGNIYANLSRNLTSGIWEKDTVYKYNGSVWTKTGIVNGNFKRLRNNANSLVVTTEYEIKRFDTNENLLSFNYNYFGAFADGLIDNNDIAWVADRSNGLIKIISNSGGEKIAPNGPRTKSVYAMAASMGHVWSVPGGEGAFNIDGVSNFTDNTWTTIFSSQPGGNMDTMYDVRSVAIDPKVPSHFFAGSNKAGLLEFENGKLIKLYNQSNSSLKSQQAVPSFYAITVSGIAYDEDENLWMTNSENNNALSVKKSNGTWQSINFTGIVNNPILGRMLVTKDSKQKWVILAKSNSILVYNDNNTFTAPNSGNSKLITNAKGQGALPGLVVNAIAEDKDGEIWIGTDKGIAVIYSPSNVFGGGDYDAKQILVQQDGYTQILLESEEVTNIAVDGANRKWIGTRKGGVFLMSADGTKEIYHFTEDNSPLLANDITAIAIDGESGEVFFGTSNGIVSFRSTATEGGEEFENVYAFPNPVQSNYTGTIAIKGLVSDVDVRITDISGQLIYKTKALGGQAIWDGKNFSGVRAQSGVYLVFCGTEDGSQTFITKILFLN